MMSFSDAIRTCLREKYVTFSGRAQRSEYWWFQLFYFLIMIALVALLAVTGGLNILVDPNAAPPGGAAILIYIVFFIVILGMFLPAISVTVRRFHDYNLSGWWYLGLIVAGIIPLVGFLASIAIFVITLLKGTAGPNNFGNDPLGANDADVFN